MWQRQNKVSYSLPRQIFQAYLVLGFTGLGMAILVVFFVFTASTLNEIDTKGVQTQALITTVEGVRGKSNKFYITYNFTVPARNGPARTYERRTVVDRNSYNRLPEGSMAPVKYLPQAPDKFRLVNVSGDDYGFTFITVFLLADAFLMLITLVHLIMLLRIQKRENNQAEWPAAGVR